ncbi:MAG TPA: RIP metalloprotease RseP [Chitinophagales bacterium]|nr:RIP metalloprotease RseP [Chitinophagales bacterium]
MNEVLIKGGQLILALSILILLHELGHFMAAKLFKVRVEKFYLFFNPGFSIFKFTVGETEYGLGWLPLGGYVKISGMIDESMDKEQMKLPPQPWEFRSKPAWQRLIIMLGGIIMNVVLGIFIYWMILFFDGELYVPNANLTYGIAVDSTGASLGFQNGDRIVGIDGKLIENFNKVPGIIILNMDQVVKVERNGQQVDIPITGDQIKEILDSKSGTDFISIRFPFVINDVSSGTPAKKINLQPGDVIVAINNQPAIFYDEARKLQDGNKDKEISLTFFRKGHLITEKVKLPSDGLLGVHPVPLDKFFTTNHIHYGFFAALPAGINRAYETLSKYIKSFALIFSPKVQGYKHLGGFIAIANAFPGEWDWITFWELTAWLSIALAFMNLLPIPALDGGHVLFTLVEMVTRRKPSDKFLEYAQIAGMIILFALLIFANGNDIMRLF